MKERQAEHQEGWASRVGLILAVASGAIGLGNFLRFPGQAAQNGGGAFMVPYIISFLLLGIPVCLAEWTMGRMGGKHGHSTPFIFREYLKGFPLKLSGAIGVMIPVMIYVYYVFIESWCLAYAYYFLTGQMSLSATTRDGMTEIASQFFITLTGAGQNGSSFHSPIIIFFLFCVLFNFLLVYRGLSKGLETFAKFAMPLMGICATIILVRVLTIPGIESGLAVMWNPDWTKLTEPKVWISAAGQIFFSLSTGFGIALVFSSFLKKKNDVVLSSLSSASLNEFAEVVFGGMITIPVAFLFLGMQVTSFGTFGMGFIALPSVFGMMPGGNFFGGLWFLVLFLAAITSSVTMLQPGILFLEEGFRIGRRKSSLLLFLFTFVLCLPIIYFNKDFAALDIADFYIGTIMIYILASIQIFIFVFKIGVERGATDANEGSLIPFPKLIQFVLKYITPWFLLFIFVSFCYMNLPEYLDKMNPEVMGLLAENQGKNVDDAKTKAVVARSVVISLFLIYGFIYFLVAKALKNRKEKGALT
ncbi:sodium:neurotransmitter symporter family protein [Leptospira yanagawae serovar Saopaulo str. Sao Paulo = ATCC 700523]|uniref:Sodium:neurotransmitter symporter family protein n=1 Tax=Leptospira yanagawae serovar Saopaulo str. Sao Paulo = ATCC 700523 TaxID=1249483 RepID=A0A5E8HE01_9LEPT|nr:sodium-dependent transporter [Leptospira yanagawae]EOQ88226.1 sodium:neurotransmitter symporter family protein [Leptospira yanagawae serovar Saopaulo str. Sao Paulo = ATCC 700523]